MKNSKILVVGNGVVGAYTALQLNKQGFDVTWCSAQSDGPQKSRFVMLNQRSARIVSNAGVDIESNGYHVSDVKVTDCESTGNFAVQSKQHKLPFIGICIDENWMYEALTKHSLELEAFEDYARAIADPASSEFAHIVATKPVANSKKLPQISKQQHVLVLHLSYRQNSDKCGTAYQFFSKHGPIGILPISHDNNQEKWMVIWSFSEREIAQKIVENGDILNEFCRHTRFDLDRLKLEKVFEAHPVQFERHVSLSKNISLISNAAHTLHPLAGQGLNLGLADAQCIADFIENGGSFNALNRKLDTARLIDRLLLGIGSEVVLLNFINHAPVARWLRARIMGSVNFVPSIKNFLVNVASGS